MSDILLKQVTSLDKVLLRDNYRIGDEQKYASMLKNERFSYQIMYMSTFRKINAEVSVSAPKGISVQLRRVGNVPCELVANREIADADYLSFEPGLYPDPLFPMENSYIEVDFNVWRSIWVTVTADESVTAGTYPIEITFKATGQEIENKCCMEIEVINASLKENELIHTQWFHSDCIASYYDVPIFSDKHWVLIEKFIEMAAHIGINMILTPVFTPPLDTVIGGERPTVQLVKVKKNGQVYTFDFTLFEKWVEICQKHGIKYFEISHLFTQWGAKFAPKIIVEENNEEKRVFGWDTEACGDEYTTFIKQFLPSLINELKRLGIEKNTYFHISDEPSEIHEESYRSASELVMPFLKDFNVIDACSDYSFYEKGLVKNPVPANDHINSFLENNVENLWTYYCCSQSSKVSNRFIAMPSYRNRILGIQLYKFDIKGFLHWGYNFYYSMLSKRKINPFCETDAGYAFPSGDSFLVYPYINGPIESIRSVVFYEALQDLRALKTLEEFTGKEKVISILEDLAGREISFESYPHSTEYILKFRERINAEIKAFVNLNEAANDDAIK